MVIGTTKTSIIENEPLLRWYLALFREVLNYGQRNLVVVGYSFMDEHINEAIVTAIESHKLRLHIVSPKQPREFKKLLCVGNSVLKSAPLGRRLWEGLFGYHTNLVPDFCKRKGQLTSQGQTFFDSLEK